MIPAATQITQPITNLFAPLVGLAYWLPYRSRVKELRRRGQATPGWRQGCFAAGLVVFALALSPPLGPLSEEIFAAHMAEHLLVGDIAALLLVLGLTGPLLQPLARLPVLRHLRTLSNPAVALPLWIVDYFVWRTPPLYEAALRIDLVHTVEHMFFMGFGMLMWMGLLGPWPKPAWFGSGARLGYVIVVRFSQAVLANVYLWSATVFYPFYAEGEASHGISPLADQGLAGGIMLIEGMLLTLGLFAWVFLKSATEIERRQELLDYARDHGVELSEQRARRAVQAGREAELWARLKAAARMEPARPAGAPRPGDSAPA